MLGPEVTYQYAQLKDTAGGTLIVVSRVAFATGLFTLFETPVYTVPEDKVFVLAAMTINTIAGAGQVASVCGCQLNINDIPHMLAHSSDVQVPTNLHDLNFSGEVWVPPGGVLVAHAQFDANANANFVNASVHGNLMPRGNVQRG